jgi:hypothetical protein
MSPNWSLLLAYLTLQNTRLCDLKGMFDVPDMALEEPKMYVFTCSSCMCMCLHLFIGPYSHMFILIKQYFTWSAVGSSYLFFKNFILQIRTVFVVLSWIILFWVLYLHYRYIFVQFIRTFSSDTLFIRFYLFTYLKVILNIVPISPCRIQTLTCSFWFEFQSLKWHIIS